MLLPSLRLSYGPDVVWDSASALLPRAEVKEGGTRDLLRCMCESLWGAVLSSLSHVVAHCSDPLIVALCVDGYRAFAFAGGVLGEKMRPPWVSRVMCLV